MSYFSSCEDEEPDLEYATYTDILNPCTGQYEYLDVRNFYEIDNYFNPNYPPRVWVYYHPDDQIFRDCLGFQWFIYPGPNTKIINPRPIANKKGGIGKRTKPAKNPAAVTYTTVTDNGGNVKNEGSIVEFLPDIPAGETRLAGTSTNILVAGKYSPIHTVDPDNDIKERDELNNSQGNDYKVKNFKNSGNSYIIRVPTKAELVNMKESYVIYKDGKITFVKK